MTYPDKTVYPVASCNDKDFANLCDVYLDAVFHPNIYKEKKIFEQEGWHYECESETDDLIYNGVVYNEMKGAYSSADDLLDRETFNSLYPDTAYGVDSGGRPSDIPSLTYEAFLDFHRRYYHPSNSYIYFYGDMDMEERLTYLDEAYLSKFDVLKIDSAIRLQKPFAAPVKVERNIRYWIRMISQTPLIILIMSASAAVWTDSFISHCRFLTMLFAPHRALRSRWL